MTCGTNWQIFLQQGAQSAEGPFTVTANILSNKEWKKKVKNMRDFSGLWLENIGKLGHSIHADTIDKLFHHNTVKSR